MSLALDLPPIRFFKRRKDDIAVGLRLDLGQIDPLSPRERQIEQSRPAYDADLVRPILFGLFARDLHRLGKTIADDGSIRPE